MLLENVFFSGEVRLVVKFNSTVLLYKGSIFRQFLVVSLVYFDSSSKLLLGRESKEA